MVDSVYARLYASSGKPINFYHTGQYELDGNGSALVITEAGIEGWWDTPEPKVDLTERASGNGAHDVNSDAIYYSARTVSVHFVAVGKQRRQVMAAMNAVLSNNGQVCKLRVTDVNSDTYAIGYISSSFSSSWDEQTDEGTLTMVCPRPERLKWDAYQVQLFPSATDAGGLSFGSDGLGLEFPIDFGSDTGAQDSGLLINNGSATAYPVLTVSGGFASGVTIMHGGKALEYQGSVGASPLTLDSRSQTASMGGVDVSRNLVRRQFPVVPAGGSVSLQLLSAGSGWVTATCRDTYI